MAEPVGADNYVFMDAAGDGQFVGVTLSLFQNQWGGWNEGDEFIWIDGEKEPRVHGTGGEEIPIHSVVSRNFINGNLDWRTGAGSDHEMI